MQDEVALGRLVAVPRLPPLTFNNSSGLRDGVLLVLRLPLAVGHVALDLEELVQLPELRPQRVVARQNGRKFNNFPLTETVVSSGVLEYLPC